MGKECGDGWIIWISIHIHGSSQRVCQSSCGLRGALGNRRLVNILHPLAPSSSSHL